MNAPFLVLLASLGLLATGIARAQSPSPSPPKEEIEAAFKDIAEHGTRGPARVTLADQAQLQLPANMLFADPVRGKRLMTDLGNQLPDQAFLGLVFPIHQTGHWMAVIEHVNEGHVPDSDAADIQPDRLLETLRKATQASNGFRQQHGFPAIEIVGWTEPPSYTASTHTLVWSAEIRDVGAPASAPVTVNYNTRVLAREGYLSINLIDDVSAIPGDRPAVGQLLGGIQFAAGKSYTDFNAKTDHVAAYGLAALIGGVAAHKLGLVALVALWAAKLWKVVLVGLAGAAAAARKLFSRRSP